MNSNQKLIEHLIASGALKSSQIIEAFLGIDRKDFVPKEFINEAYEDYPLPIRLGQTISQPYTVAFMLELLQPKFGDKILDVGFGSGWTTCLLAYIVSQTRISADFDTDKHRLWINTDESKLKPGLLYEDLTYKIRGAIFNVYNKLGPAFKGNVYQKALEKEFKIIGLVFEKEKILDIVCNNKKIGTYKPDFIIDDKIILELKALPFLSKLEKKQIWYYLKGSNYKLALLVNFGRKDLQIERIIHGYGIEGEGQNKKNIRVNPCNNPCESVFLSGRVYAVELVPEIFVFGEKNIEKYNFVKKGIVKVFCGDGSAGLKKFSPFDKILVSAACVSIPNSLILQLKPGATLVIPDFLGIWKITKTASNKIERQYFQGFAFVPLVNKKQK